MKTATLFCVGLAVTTALGCGHQVSGTFSGGPPSTQAKPAVASQGTAAAPEKEVSRGSGVFAVRDKIKAMAEMDQLRTMVFADYLVRGTGPANLDEIKQSLRDVPKLLKPIEDGKIKFVPNAKLNDGKSVVFYESLPDRQGDRLIVFGDGRVDTMNTDDFKAFEATLKKE